MKGISILRSGIVVPASRMGRLLVFDLRCKKGLAILDPVVGCETGGRDIVPLYSRLYSAPDCDGEDSEIIKAVRQVSRGVGKKGVWVIDRGGDRGRLYDYFLTHRFRFLIRLKGDRHLVHQGRKIIARELTQSCPLPYREVLVREESQSERVYQLSFGCCEVRLPDFPQTLWMLVIKGFGVPPKRDDVIDQFAVAEEPCCPALGDAIVSYALASGRDDPLHQAELCLGGCAGVDLSATAEHDGAGIGGFLFHHGLARRTSQAESHLQAAVGSITTHLWYPRLPLLRAGRRYQRTAATIRQRPPAFPATTNSQLSNPPLLSVTFLGKVLSYLALDLLNNLWYLFML